LENKGTPAPAKPTILVAPLDWGLGHATRCIPVIHSLLRQGAAVYLAGEGRTKTLLEEAFPELPFLPLRGYRIRYARNSRVLPFKIVSQLPQMIRAIEEEHEWLRNAAQQYGFDGIISDNRYGLYHPSLPTAIITHQLCIQTGMGRLADRAVQRLHYRMINRFSHCWVPDAAGAPNLSGALAHPAHVPCTGVDYIGPLSRFAPAECTNGDGPLLILLSGPEPQRGLLEAQLVDELRDYEGNAVLVRGLPGDDPLPPLPPGVIAYNHLGTAALREVLQSASFVLARSGYSTVMDLHALRKKAIFIPTPAQTEQGYLARYLMQQGMAPAFSQSKFRLRPALDLAASFPYRFSTLPAASLLDDAVSRFLLRTKGT